MEELEVTKELFLLRGAIELARQQGCNFLDESAGQESLDACGQIIVDAIEEIDMLMTVDGCDREVIIEAHKTLHLALFHKTLITSGEEDKPDAQYFEHALATFPEIGWSVYVRCIQLCDWIEFAVECWRATTPSRQIVICKRVLHCIKSLDDAKAVRLWQWSIETVCQLVRTTSDAKLFTMPIVKIGLELTNHIHEPFLKVAVSQCLIDTVKLFSSTLVESDFKEDTKIETVMRISQSILTMASTEDVRKCLTACFDKSWVQFLNSVKEMSYGAESPPSEHLILLKDTASLLKELTSFEESREDRLRRALATANLESNKLSDTKEILLNHLEEEFLLSIINCFLDPAVHLSPAETLQLVRRIASASACEAEQLRKVIFKAFATWTFEIQDEFRHDCFKVCQELDIHLKDPEFSKNLTEAMNRMSSNAVIRDYSLLCLQSPSETIDAIVNYALSCGQSKTIANILSNLKSSCNIMNQSDVSPLLTSLEKVLEKILNFSEMENTLLLLKELINSDLLPWQDFLSKCVFPYTSPSQSFIQTLKVMQVLLTTTTKDVNLMIRPAPFLAVLANSLHHCMHVDMFSIDYDVLVLKKETLLVQKLILKKIKNGSLNMQDREVHWLWKQQQPLHKVVKYSMRSLFLLFGLEKDSILYHELPLEEALVALSLSKSNKECCPSLFLNDDNPSDSIQNLVISLAQVLPRLTMEETRNLLFILSRYMASFYGSSLSRNAVAAEIEQTSRIMTIILILNCLIWLCVHPVCTTHLSQTVHICSTAIKSSIIDLPNMPFENIVSLIYVTTTLTELLPVESEAVGKLLILDLLNQLPKTNATNETVAANVLKDSIDSLRQDEFQLHIIKLMERLYCQK